MDYTFTSKVIVSAENVAETMGSGDLQVFATPAMVALMENAAMMAAKQLLKEGETTVGGKIDATHLRPSPIGEEISATAQLIGQSGAKLTFEVSANDSKGVIGKATHIRFIVNVEKFLSKL